MFIIVVYPNQVHNTHLKVICHGKSDDHVKVYCPSFLSYQQRRVGSHSCFHITDYSLSYSDLRVLSLGLKFTPSPPNVDRLNLKESLRRFGRNSRLRDNLAESDSPVDSDTIKFRKKTTYSPPPNRDEALDMILSVVDSEQMNPPEQKKHS